MYIVTIVLSVLFFRHVVKSWVIVAESLSFGSLLFSLSALLLRDVGALPDFSFTYHRYVAIVIGAVCVLRSFSHLVGSVSGSVHGGCVGGEVSSDQLLFLSYLSLGTVVITIVLMIF